MRGKFPIVATMEKLSLKEIVDRRLKVLDVGPIEAATQGGLERTFIRDIVEGKKRRVLDYSKLAKALGLDADALSRGEYREQGVDPLKAPGLRTVQVSAHVEAGYWADHWEWADDEKYDVVVPRDPELDGFTLKAAETRGPSMNRRYPERTIVVFTDPEETQESPRVGKRYVVQRTRNDGAMEHTVKLLHQDEKGKFWLVPESTDPLFQQPIPIGDDDGETVEVRLVGRVRYSVQRE